MLPKTSLAKPEVSTLQKTGSFYFALTLSGSGSVTDFLLPSEHLLSLLFQPIP